MPICTVDEDQLSPHMVKTIYGDIVIVWDDDRNGNIDIYAQKIDSRGKPLWDINEKGN